METNSLKEPKYTTDDIEVCSVYMKLKDGPALAANVKDKMVIDVIASWCQFAELPPDRVTTSTLQELICQSK